MLKRKVLYKILHKPNKINISNILYSLKYYFTTKDKKSKSDINKQNKLKKDINFSPKPKELSFVLLMNNTQSKKYYCYNLLFLSIYTVYSFTSVFALNSFPDHLNNVMFTFGMMSFSSICFMYYYSNRHIKSIILNKVKNTLTIENHRFFGLKSPNKYELNIDKDIKYITPLKIKFFPNYKTGIYVLKLKTNKDEMFDSINVLYLRPTNITNIEEFNNVFKKLIKNNNN